MSPKINSRNKGAAGEREWAKYLQAIFACFNAHRGRQYHGGPESPDVAEGLPGTHAEVKRVERLNISQAMEQAETDAPTGTIPYVAHRRNHGEWMITLRAKNLRRFCTRLIRHLSKEERKS